MGRKGWLVYAFASLAPILSLSLGSIVFAEDVKKHSEEQFSINEFEKKVEYSSGVRFPFSELCTPFFGAKEKLPLGCDYGEIDVSIDNLTTHGLKLLPILLQHSTSGAWIDPRLTDVSRVSVSLFDWGFEPTLVWQASGQASSAVCGYQDPLELTDPPELPPVMAATCYLIFPPWEKDELIVRIRFEAIQEVSSTFALPASEDPFLSRVTYFVFKTYSLGGFYPQ